MQVQVWETCPVPVSPQTRLQDGLLEFSPQGPRNIRSQHFIFHFTNLILTSPSHQPPATTRDVHVQLDTRTPQPLPATLRVRWRLGGALVQRQQTFTHTRSGMPMVSTRDAVSAMVCADARGCNTS